MKETASYTIETPLGGISIHAEDGFPVCMTFAGDGDIRDEGCWPPPPAVEELMQAVASYFRSEEVDPAVAEMLIVSMDVTPFEEAVLREVAAIPAGETASYGEIAEMAGYPRAARAVGNVMHGNPFPIVIPCHRVIRSDGSLGGYGGAEGLKAWLIDFETPS